MIQFNLLPDVKIQYIKAKSMKRLVMLAASFIAAFSLFIVISLFMVNVFQSKHLSDLNKDIKTDSAKLQSTPNLAKILTVQNQLLSLPGLHAKKPVSSRLFAYVTKLTPSKASISSLDIDFIAGTLKVVGAADKLETVNQFVDTLKFTEYSKGTSTTKAKAFSNVVLKSFGRDDKGASYTIELKFDPVIFDVANEINLIIPDRITTRSATEKPDALFQPLSNSQDPLSPKSGTTPKGNN